MQTACTYDVIEKGNHLSLLSPAKSLLVIEDDLALIELFDIIIDDLRPDLDWEYATSAEKGMASIYRRSRVHRDMPFNLVLTDIFLEGDSTGFDVWQECQEFFPQMPFVFISSLPFDRYSSFLQGSGSCPSYLLKPLSVSRCQSVLNEYL